jgi:hypothetical protein
MPALLSSKDHTSFPNLLVLNGLSLVKGKVLLCFHILCPFLMKLEVGNPISILPAHLFFLAYESPK